MARYASPLLLLAFALSGIQGFSVSMKSDAPSSPTISRRGILSSGAAAALATTCSVAALPKKALAGPEIYNLPSGIKYANLKMPENPKKAIAPQQGDIVAIEFTGYLADGKIFDRTHAEGTKNALLFKLGSTAVIPGLNEMVSNMVVGQKVQAIIPPSQAFGDEGICLENGECLVKPGSTLVYDVTLKKSSIPPP